MADHVSDCVMRSGRLGREMLDTQVSSQWLALLPAMGTDLIV
jgi:hypothetical protein